MSATYERDIHKRLGVRAAGRSVVSNNGTTVLKEHQSPYGTLYASKEDLSCQDNAYYLSINC